MPSIDTALALRSMQLHVAIAQGAERSDPLPHESRAGRSVSQPCVLCKGWQRRKHIVAQELRAPSPANDQARVLQITRRRDRGKHADVCRFVTTEDFHVVDHP